MDWQAVRGAGARRFCGECQKHVHDLSEMSAVEAHALPAGPRTETLCVRYLYDESGEIVLARAKLVARSSLVRAKRFATAALAVALPMSLTACMGAAQRPPAPLTPPPAYTQTMSYPTRPFLQPVQDTPMAANAGADAAPALRAR